jgi:putative restriction endonuclease
LKEQSFKNWLIRNNRPLRYSKTLITISKDLKKVNYNDYDLYSIQNIDIVKRIKNDYLNINEYYEKNHRGQNMYNSALNRYIEFLEDNNQNILLEDIQQIIGNTIVINTEKENLVKCRIGQGDFRDKLIKYWNGCSVTRYQNTEILIASHIKPWRESTSEERLDSFNGLLLTPNLDKLFDKGFISFDDEGKILISKSLINFELLGIDKNMKIAIENKHRKYLNFHRNKIFKDY